MHLVEMVQEHISTSTKGRTLFQTEKGYIGLSTPGVKVGDIVSVLFGCKTPVILREEGSEYTLVGDSFIYGLMDGQ